MPDKIHLTSLARAAAMGLVALSVAACADPSYSRSAANAPQSGSSMDVVGAGGRQDALARQIHHPGSGTNF